MKWLVLLGGVFLLVVWLVLRGAPDPVDGTAKHETTAASRGLPSRPVVQASAPGVESPAPTAAIALRGVLFRGAGSEQSQALLSVAGRPAQVFRRGETVDQSWMLESIQQDHVIIARDGVKSRLNVVGEAGGPALAAASAVKDTPLPGFVKSPPPAAALSTAPSRESNKRFLQDRQNRLSGAGAASR